MPSTRLDLLRDMLSELCIDQGVLLHFTELETFVEDPASALALVTAPTSGEPAELRLPTLQVDVMLAVVNETRKLLRRHEAGDLDLFRSIHTWTGRAVAVLRLGELSPGRCTLLR